MSINSEHNFRLQCKVKSLTAQVKGFKSGKKYVKLRSEYEKQLAKKGREIKKLKKELSDAHARSITSRKNWMEVFEDVEKERGKELRESGREKDALEKRALKAERERDALRDTLTKKNQQLYEVKTELEEEKGKNQKLMAQLNRDYENSSIPSSMKVNKKKPIPNSRKSTDKRPGGQPGHKGHSRKKHKPTRVVDIPVPKEWVNGSNYRETGKIIRKQVVNIRISLDITEFATPEYRRMDTGQRVHAKFPDGVTDDVNYGGTVKAILLLLKDYCNVSIKKAQEFISSITDGELNISDGMISGLDKEFSSKTQAEQKKAFADILISPVMNTDFTNTRVNGKTAQVLVCATPDVAMYFAREHKGHEGIKGTPVEDYQGILVHDHDKTFYNYGTAHQECMAHPQRYLKDSMDNEPNLKWNKKMRNLITEIIHYRNSLPDDTDPDPKIVKKYEERYSQVLTLAKEEYEYEPPSDYYKEGFNLFKRLLEYKENHLLFLHDIRVPTTNNLSERLLRSHKRKLKQVMSFRSFDSLSYLLSGMGIIASLRETDKNLYGEITDIFDRVIR